MQLYRSGFFAPPLFRLDIWDVTSEIVETTFVISRFSDILKRNDFVPCPTQKKQPEIRVVKCCFLSKHKQERTN